MKIISHLECLRIHLRATCIEIHLFWFARFQCGAVGGSSGSSNFDMDKIQVQWTDGSSKGTILFVKRSTIREGTVAVGEKVKVFWGKSKKAYNAKVLRVSSIPSAPPTPNLLPMQISMGLMPLHGLKLACCADFRLWRTS